FRTAVDLPTDATPRIFAAHVVAAAVLEALAANGNIPVLFERMVGILDAMHKANPSWGPLFVRHPGNLFRQRAFLRHHSCYAGAGGGEPRARPFYRDTDWRPDVTARMLVTLGFSARPGCGRGTWGGASTAEIGRAIAAAI